MLNLILVTKSTQFCIRINALTLEKEWGHFFCAYYTIHLIYLYYDLPPLLTPAFQKSNYRKSAESLPNINRKFVHKCRLLICVLFKKNLTQIEICNILIEQGDKIMKCKESKIKSIVFRATDEDRIKIHKLAKKSKMTPSKYMRMVTTLDRDINEKLINELSTKIQEKDKIIDKQKIKYKKILQTAKKAVYVAIKLTKFAGSELEGGIKKEVIGDIRKQLRKIEKENVVLKK